MRSTTLVATVLLSALSLVQAQTFTECDPTKKSTCPSDPALGKTLTTDFTKGKSSDYFYLKGTDMTYGSSGAEFSITSKLEAPTIESHKYIFFGKVSAYMKASPGVGIVSSFILESDDLDEIDWEWVGGDNFHVQTNFFGKGDTTTYDRGLSVPADAPVDKFHTYTIDWTAERIIWSVDDVPVRTLSYNDPVAHGGTRYPPTPMKIMMGSWIGCIDINDPEKKGTCEWVGGEAVFTDATKYQMFVKTVTVEDYSTGESYSYGDMSGSWQSIVIKDGSASGSDEDSPSKDTPSSSLSTIKASTSKAGVFAQTSTGSSSISTSVSSSESKSTSSSADVKTTLTTATTPETTAGTSTTGSGSTDSPTDTGAPVPTESAAPGAATVLKSSFGGLVIAGFGLGFLVL
jgi:beta-glucanase (GH16 family)